MSFKREICPPHFHGDEVVRRVEVIYSLVKSFGKSKPNSNNYGLSLHMFSVVNGSIFYLKQFRNISSTTPLPNITTMLRELFVHNSPDLDHSFTMPKSSTDSSQSVLPLKNAEQTFKVSVTVKSAAVRSKRNMADVKSNVCNGVALNLELVNRKNRELQKQSKKRRRRQKKGCYNSKIHVPESSLQCLSQSQEKDSQFIFTVKQQDRSSPNLTSQFVISVADLNDDDSDWESFGLPYVTDTPECEFAGLFVTNFSYHSLSCPSQSFKIECNLSPYTKQEAEELIKLETVLSEVNKNWNENTKDVKIEPKLHSKVSFASDDQLVEVLPVDIYDRKGEWELYAIERMRFKRRIDELAKVISPCLTEDHRSKIFKNFIQDTL